MFTAVYCRGRSRLHVAGQRVVGVLNVDTHGLCLYGFLRETMKCGVRAAVDKLVSLYCYISWRHQSQCLLEACIVSNAVAVCVETRRCN